MATLISPDYGGLEKLQVVVVFIFFSNGDPKKPRERWPYSSLLMMRTRRCQRVCSQARLFSYGDPDKQVLFGYVGFSSLWVLPQGHGLS